jgi:DNA-binding ferritin-like protein
VTGRDNFRIAYGALRAILIALQPFNARQVDIKKILADKKIEEAIAEAFQYNEYLRNIRKGAQRIISNARSVAQNVDDLDNCLKQCLKQLQQRIDCVIHEVD